jgi:hypothetical protein
MVVDGMTPGHRKDFFIFKHPSGWTTCLVRNEVIKSVREIGGASRQERS